MTTVSNKKLCVYTHSADGKIFYVGQGRPGRPYEQDGRSLRWHSHVEEAGGGYEITIHAWANDRAEALRIEREMIAAHSPPCNGREKPADRREVTAIYLTPPVKAALEKAAKVDGRSVSNYLEMMILKDLRERGLLRWQL